MAKTKEEYTAYMREYMRTYREEHREEINANNRYNYARSPECRERKRESAKRWRENNRERWNAYAREYRLRKARATNGNSGN